MHRGRSREVSFSALARQASEQRRAFQLASPCESPLQSPSPSPHSSRSASIERMHSESLHNQLHIAYAHDDIHLAKTLLLRLKGIAITDTNDPRVMSIQPEDFDEIFCPGGGLMNVRDDWKAVEEMRIRETLRIQKLWRQEEDRRWETRIQNKWERSKRSQRKLLSYASLATEPLPRVEKPLEYACMVTPSLPARRKTRPESPPSVAVTFQEVLICMRGSLFPAVERRRSKSSHKSLSRRTEAELLDGLLDAVKWEEGERKRRKGKERAVPIRRDTTEDHCPTCSAVSPATSSVSSSWLSFGSSSLSTAITIPSPSSPSGSRWLKGPDPSQPPSPVVHACCRPFSRLSPIPLSQGPLFSPREVSEPSAPEPCHSNQKREGRVSRLGKSVSRFIELARVLQNAYGVASSWDAEALASKPLRPPGYRASPKDVALLAMTESSSSDSTKCIPLISPFPPVHPPRTTLPDPLPYPIIFKPQILPAPSPLKRFARSALMNASRTVGPVARQRYIPNPMFLRLQALKNIVWERGVDWEGHGRDGMLGCGKEKVIGLAFEETGRSLLAIASS